MIILGAGIAFIAAVSNALALVLQSLEARDMSEDGQASLGMVFTLLRRPRWVLGTVLLVIGWPLQILALSFAPLTVVQPTLSSFQLVLLALARVWLGEPVGRREVYGAGTMVLGVAVVIVAAPHRSVFIPGAGRLAAPIALVGLSTLALYGRARLRSGRGGLDLTVAAGLGYAWVDFVDKLVSNDLSKHHLVLALVWLAGALVIGAVAFISEQAALTGRPASMVGPLIGSIQEPLPVILALWGGLEVWQGGPGRAVALALGLVMVGVGAAVIARSPALAGLSEPPDPAPQPS